MRTRGLALLTMSSFIVLIVYLYFPSGAANSTLPKVPAPVTLELLDEEKVTRDGDLRVARLLRPGTHAIDLGDIGESRALRIAFAPRGVTPVLPRAWVMIDDSPLAEIEAKNAESWVDARIDLPPHAPSNAKCQVVFRSDTALLIHDCQLIAPRDTRPNVLVFLIDTLRQDHLGCYGYHRPTSPNIDAVAKESIRLTSMISQSSWTRPAVASLMTGRYPSVHGVNDRPDVLSDDIPTIAEMFMQAGYTTQGFMSNVQCLPRWGFGKGFARYLDVDALDTTPAKDADVVDAAIHALHNLNGAPWFFYVHAIGPHEPYEPPAPYDTMFANNANGTNNAVSERAQLIDRYDGEIAFTDAQFGRLICTLRELDMYDNTIIVVLSDHGEQFWDHGMIGHGQSLYDEEIRVPFLIKLPSGQRGGTVVDEVCQLLDVPPTLLELTSLPEMKDIQGRSFQPLLMGDTVPPRPAFASLFVERKGQYAARSHLYKYVNDIAEHHTSWFDLLADPDERAPLREMPAAAAGLVRFASTVANRGGAGLHLLITGSLMDPHTIAGTIRGDGLGDYQLTYPANNGTIEIEDNAIQFSVTTSPGPNTPINLVTFHETGAEQNHAHIRVNLEKMSPVNIAITLDGEPISETLVFAGPERRPIILDGAAPIEPRSLTANSEIFDPLILPRRLAVYLWYVPGAGMVADHELKPEMIEALKTLGYL